MIRFIVSLACLSLFQFPFTAHAYVGPGLGLGTLGVVFGIIASIFFAIVGVFYYPIKRIVRKFRKNKLKENA